MVGVFVAFIRVVYGSMIYMSLPTTASTSSCTSYWQTVLFLRASLTNGMTG